MAHYPDQSDRLTSEVGTEQVGTAARGVARGECEVGRLGDRLQSLREHVRGRDREGDAGRDDLLLGAGDPCGHGRLGDEEEAGDVVGADTQDKAQRQGAGSLGRECRVGAHQDEAEQGVLLLDLLPALRCHPARWI